MSTNWKLLAEKENAKTYVLPAGWDSRDSVATQLDCSPEKVDDHLRPALKSGKVIKQTHRVWDSVQKRAVMIVAYHDTALDAKAQPAPKASTGSPSADQIRKLKSSGKTWAEIGAAIGLAPEKARSIFRRL